MIDKFECIKLRTSTHEKKPLREYTLNHRQAEMTFLTDKGLISKPYTELPKINKLKTHKPIP